MPASVAICFYSATSIANNKEFNYIYVNFQITDTKSNFTCTVAQFQKAFYVESRNRLRIQKSKIHEVLRRCKKRKHSLYFSCIARSQQPLFIQSSSRCADAHRNINSHFKCELNDKRTCENATDGAVRTNVWHFMALWRLPYPLTLTLTQIKRVIFCKSCEMLHEKGQCRLPKPSCLVWQWMQLKNRIRTCRSHTKWSWSNNNSWAYNCQSYLRGDFCFMMKRSLWNL